MAIHAIHGIEVEALHDTLNRINNVWGRGRLESIGFGGEHGTLTRVFQYGHDEKAFRVWASQQGGYTVHFLGRTRRVRITKGQVT